jgi:hypothetical protein
MSKLKDAIRNSGLFYKEVAGKTGYTISHVSSDVAREQVSAAKAILYARALGIDPAELRPDVFKPGEVSFKC